MLGGYGLMYKEQQNELDCIWKPLCQSRICFVTGEKGIGKSTLIDNFLNGKNNYIRIKKIFETDYYLTPIIDALSRHSKSFCASPKENLSMPEYLTQSLLEFCDTGSSIIFFEGICFYDKNLLSYCINISKLLLDYFPNNKLLIVYEMDEDVDVSIEIRECIDQLYTITGRTDFIRLGKWSDNALVKLLKNLLAPRMDISEPDLKYIISTAFGNPSRLLLVTNYLKQMGYIFWDDEFWTCLNLSAGLLDDVIQKYVIERYSKLSGGLKTVLQKSSLIGYEFTVEELQQSFQLLRAAQDLIRIEKISKLIHNSEPDHNELFSFETHEIFHTIRDNIPAEENSEWCRVLSVYYENHFSEIVRTEVERFQLCRRLAFYCEESNQFDKAISYYMQGINASINLLDYQQASTLVRKAKHIIGFLPNPPIPAYEFELREAFCNDALGNYLKAVHCYKKILFNNTISSDSVLEIQYSLACSQYNAGMIVEAEVQLESLLHKLQIEKNDKLLLNVKSELATIYHFKRDYGRASEAFKQALYLSKESGFQKDYYILIRKSSMFWDMELTLPMMLEGSTYFKAIGDLKEFAKTEHNIGADMLWTGNSEAILHLESAKESFLKFGSNNVQYSYNCIGIYKALIEKDYRSAVSIFSLAQEQFFTDNFSRLALTLNLANCYFLMSDMDKALAYLNKAVEIHQELKLDIPSYSLYYLIDFGLYYKHLKNYKESAHYFIASMKYRLLNDQLFLVGKNLLICEEHCGTLDIPHEEIQHMANIIPHPMYQQFYHQNVCFGTLRFWE